MEPHIITLPKWVLIVRIIIALLSLIVLAMSAYGIYWVAFNSWCFALFVSLATLIIVGYNILTTHVASCKGAYNYWAVLGLDIFGIIFWLSSMAALASTRAAFKYPTTIDYCYGGYCYKRDLSKRTYVATNGYLAMMSTSAGISALIMLLFIAILVIFSINLRKHRAEKSHTTTPGPITNDKLEAQPVPMNSVAYQQAPNQQYPPQPYPQQDPNQQYPPQPYPQQQQQPYGPPHNPVHYTPTPPPGNQYAPPSPQSPQPQYVAPQPYHQAPEVVPTQNQQNIAQNVTGTY